MRNYNLWVTADATAKRPKTESTAKAKATQNRARSSASACARSSEQSDVHQRSENEPDRASRSARVRARTEQSEVHQRRVSQPDRASSSANVRARSQQSDVHQRRERQPDRESLSVNVRVRPEQSEVLPTFGNDELTPKWPRPDGYSTFTFGSSGGTASNDDELEAASASLGAMRLDSSVGR